MATTLVGKYAPSIAATFFALAFMGIAGGYYAQSMQTAPQTLPTNRWITEAYGADPAQVYDIFRPAHAKAGAPMVIVVHGGSEEEGGDKSRMRSRAEWYAEQGAVVVTPNYRYADGMPPKDVGCAIATAQKNAARYGADPERMVVHGFSFGGWTSSFALFAREKLVDSDCAVKDPLRARAFIGESTQFGLANKGENIYNDIVPDGRDGAINYLDQTDADIAVLLLHGTKDPKFNEQRAQDFADAFRRQGGSATVHIYEGFGHSSRLPDNARTQRDVLDFLDSLE